MYETSSSGHSLFVLLFLWFWLGFSSEPFFLSLRQHWARRCWFQFDKRKIQIPTGRAKRHPQQRWPVRFYHVNVGPRAV
jgi:hypothetical protein